MAFNKGIREPFFTLFKGYKGFLATLDEGVCDRGRKYMLKEHVRIVCMRVSRAEGKNY